MFSSPLLRAVLCLFCLIDMLPGCFAVALKVKAIPVS